MIGIKYSKLPTVYNFQNICQFLSPENKSKIYRKGISLRCQNCRQSKVDLDFGVQQTLERIFLHVLNFFWHSYYSFTVRVLKVRVTVP